MLHPIHLKYGKKEDKEAKPVLFRLLLIMPSSGYDMDGIRRILEHIFRAGYDWEITTNSVKEFPVSEIVDSKEKVKKFIDIDPALYCGVIAPMGAGMIPLYHDPFARALVQTFHYTGKLVIGFGEGLGLFVTGKVFMRQNLAVPKCLVVHQALRLAIEEQNLREVEDCSFIQDHILVCSESKTHICLEWMDKLLAGFREHPHISRLS